jgi:hypothetical protein
MVQLWRCAVIRPPCWALLTAICHLSPHANARAAGLTNYLVGALDAALAHDLQGRQVPSFAMYQLPGQGEKEYTGVWGDLEVTKMGRQKVGREGAWAGGTAAWLEVPSFPSTRSIACRCRVLWWLGWSEEWGLAQPVAPAPPPDLRSPGHVSQLSAHPSRLPCRSAWPGPSPALVCRWSSATLTQSGCRTCCPT